MFPFLSAEPHCGKTPRVGLRWKNLRPRRGNPAVCASFTTAWSAHHSVLCVTSIRCKGRVHCRITKRKRLLVTATMKNLFKDACPLPPSKAIHYWYANGTVSASPLHSDSDCRFTIWPNLINEKNLLSNAPGCSSKYTHLCAKPMSSVFNWRQ